MASFRDTLERGIGHHRAGRFAEAEALYRHALQIAPDHPDALHLLGGIAEAEGRFDEALDRYRRALTQDPGNAMGHDGLGRVLLAQGKSQEASASMARAVALAPLSAHLHYNLAVALSKLGQRDAAIASYRKALSLKPDYAEAHNNLGVELEQHGMREQAVACYHSALRLRPDYPDAWHNLGNALRVLGQDESALACLRNAVELDARPAFRVSFVECAKRLDRLPVDPPFRRIVASAISQAWVRPADLAELGVRLLRADPDVRKSLDACARAWPARPSMHSLLGPSGFDAIGSNELILAMMESMQVYGLDLERFLTLVRHAMLEEALSTGSRAVANADALAFCCALARQCFINDFVFSSTDEEMARATDLRGAVVAALESSKEVPALSLAVVASYFPLGSLPCADKLLGRSWPGPLAALLAQQVAEPLAEWRYREALPRITAIVEDTSRRVMEQYEENPYPKWVKLPAYAGDLRNPEILPLLEWSPSLAREGHAVDILVAGCGTGQESIEWGSKFPSARVLGIDLSLASLAYAQRKARELGMTNLEHAQADIMKLGTVGRTFDIISSVGVLHHLADPIAGWRLLLSLLRPGGLMLVGLYSEKGRQDVVAARKLIAERGYGSRATDIRKCREELTSSEANMSLASRTDFYGISECRDLLFHVEEHRFTLPAVKEMIAALGVEFMDFVVDSDVAASYRRRFPESTSMNDLDGWNDFESEFPTTFSGMYVFWVRKPDPPPPPR
ncbi:MAG: tetratricopeptide repeat protein [Usitatibacter sp.]